MERREREREEREGGDFSFRVYAHRATLRPPSTSLVNISNRSFFLIGIVVQQFYYERGLLTAGRERERRERTLSV
jgi:hypothetical protein